MKLVRVALLLIVQLSYVFSYVNGSDVYECTGRKTSFITVRDAGARLTNGCVLNDTYLTFDMKAIYGAAMKALKNNVVIDISYTAFIKTSIKLANAHTIPGDINKAVPLLFTMSYSNMSGSKLIFGDNGLLFKLPPHSHLQILHCELTKSANDDNTEIFMFLSLLLSNSSMEIAYNMISMESVGGTGIMSVFYLPQGTKMCVSEGSRFTLRDNEITIKGGTTAYLNQYIWHQDMSSVLTISDSSTYTWVSNIITVVGYNVSVMIRQYVWYSYSSITISSLSELLFISNRILLLAKNYRTTMAKWSYVMRISFSSTSAILGGSSVVWRDNCVGIGQERTDEIHVLVGNWSIVDGGALLLDGNYFTTTEEYKKTDSVVTEFVWGDTWETYIAISDGTLTIRNTTVHANSVTNGVTGSMLWSSASVTTKASWKPTMVWSSSPANDSNGSPIPTIDNSNLGQYMCVGIPPIAPPTVPTAATVNIPNATRATKPKSTTAVFSTIPAVLNTLIVFLCCVL